MDMIVTRQSVIIKNGEILLFLIILIVVASIFKFRDYYIQRDVSNNVFVIIISLFLLLMITMLSNLRLMLFLRWEGIGLMSFLLIGYWKRPDGKSGAVSAIIYNRVGDLFFIVFYVTSGSEVVWLLALAAVLCKSSIYLYSY